MLHRRSFLTLAAAGLLRAPALRAAPIAVARAGLIFLTVEVNGRPAKALVDTGGSRGIQLSDALARQAGLALRETGRTIQRYDGARPLLATTLATLAFAGIRLSDVEANVVPGDIESISGQIGEAFDAILGWRLLAARPFVIDYPAGTFEVRADAGIDGVALPLEAGRPLPVTAGRLGDQAVTFLIDTGAPFSNVDPGLAGGAAAGSRVDLAFEIGGRSFTDTFRVKDLAAMTRGLGARAVIGHHFVSTRRFVWQPEAHIIRLV